MQRIFIVKAFISPLVIEAEKTEPVALPFTIAVISVASLPDKSQVYDAEPPEKSKVVITQ